MHILNLNRLLTPITIRSQLPVSLLRIRSDFLRCCSSVPSDPADPPRSVLSTPNASSANLRHRTFDVFLSFRGPDIRNSFLSHLYRALRTHGFYAFIDSERLRAGDEISPSLEWAIEGSRVAVVLFSDKYATSKWCLNELVKIMECRALRELRVKPVFYKVDPREVRTPRKGYAEALAGHEEKLGTDPKKVREWRRALFNAGCLSGWHLVDGDDEADLVERIVKDVSRALDRVPLEVAKYPVGISSRLQAIRPQLHLDPYEDAVYMIAIHGPGGGGKTTLAKAIYNEMFHKFNGSCFLSNVRETSGRTNGLVVLQQMLLSEILTGEGFTLSSVDAGKALIKERFRSTKVLVVLDDVDNIDQLNALAGDKNWFGEGSRVIVTTRDEHLVTSHGIQEIYKIRLLDSDEARELFCHHAFPWENRRMNIDEVIVSNFLAYADCLPLALVVLGTFLCGRSEPEWRSTLKRLEKSPERTINAILKISFDGLEDHEKEVFLDIACFFKGRDRDYVEKVLHSCGFESLIGLRILVERCLLTVERGIIQMHELLAVMGKDIVYQECPDDPRNRSRIWLYEDILEVLSSDYMVTTTVKGIVMGSHGPNKIHVNPEVLKGMKRLRLLIVRGDIFLGGPIHLPSEVRWFEWPKYSESSIEFHNPRKLVGFHAHRSNLKQLGTQQFDELRFMNLGLSKSLETLPDLSTSSNLESLSLLGCESLNEVHKSIGCLKKLVHLDLRYCSNLRSIPSILKSKNLQTLNLAWCSKLSDIPDFLDELEFLEQLNLEKTAVKELPESIRNLIAVEIVNLNDCTDLAVLPSSMYGMQALREINASGCTSLIKFPRRTADLKGIGGFQYLEILNLGHCNLEDVDFLKDLTCHSTLKEVTLSGNHYVSLPECVCKFDNLKILHLDCCSKLREVFELPTNLADLRLSGCRQLERFPYLHTFVGHSPRRSSVDLSNCHNLGRHYIDMALLYEQVRKFIGAADIIIPGKELPRWMTFKSIEWYRPYQVYLPVGVLEDEILGLALSVSFRVGRVKSFSSEVSLKVGSSRISRSDTITHPWESFHTWFVYLPRQAQPVAGEEGFLMDVHWSNIRVGFSGKGLIIERCGIHVVCKDEEDDRKIVIIPDGREKVDSEDDEHEIECDGDGGI